MSARINRRRRIAAALAPLLCFSVDAIAQDRGQGEGPGPTALGSSGVAPVAVEETDIRRDAFSTGVLSETEGGFSRDLWAGASGTDLERLLALAPPRPSSPAMGRLLRRLLLTRAAAPDGAPSSLGGRKLLALARAGFVDEARTIASFSSAPPSDPWVNRALAVADLLEDDVAGACRREDRVTSDRGALFWVKLRVLCYSETDRFDSADLTLGVLREQGALSAADDALLTAASIPAPLKKPVAPRDAIQLAALRKLNGAAAPGFETTADVGVLSAVATSDEADPRLRLRSASAAAALGAMSVEALAALYASLSVNSDLTLADDDVLVDASRYQRIAEMAAPEFRRDKAAAIAEAVTAPQSFERAYVAAMLYADDVEDLEGVIVTPDQAGAFALVAMADGRANAAGRWLLAMMAGDFASLNEVQALRFLERVNLLGVLDPREAEIVAAAANVRIDPPRGLELDPASDRDRQRLAAIVSSAFNAATAGAEGQLALAAIALSNEAFTGDPVADGVAAASMKAAGLEDVHRRHAFETAWAASFPSAQAAADEPTLNGDADGFAPSLKPRN